MFMRRAGPGWSATSARCVVHRRSTRAWHSPDRGSLRALSARPRRAASPHRTRHRGLVVQALLDRGLGTCGVAIASAPIKGIWTLPYSKMRVVTPQLIVPRNSGRPVVLTPRAVSLRVHEQLVARRVLRTFMSVTRCPGHGECCCRRNLRTSTRSLKPRSTCSGTIARRCC